MTTFNGSKLEITLTFLKVQYISYARKPDGCCTHELDLRPCKPKNYSGQYELDDGLESNTDSDVEKSNGDADPEGERQRWKSTRILDLSHATLASFHSTSLRSFRRISKRNTTSGLIVPDADCPSVFANAGFKVVDVSSVSTYEGVLDPTDGNILPTLDEFNTVYEVFFNCVTLLVS
jgi:hypothetical protein